ncbi:aroma-sacti cluster domain-containing protein [Kitasatospora camelliae]|uniref:Aroma-sacti cluster domain-containing protein n=1 Tax=Kitasatospora camelliae TaxID=3156397 RepID=A0AAU8K3L8_9ACTN
MTDRENTLRSLEAAGFAVHAFTEEQQEVLQALTPHELAVLVDIKGRLDEVGPEVQAHGEIAGGALF